MGELRNAYSQQTTARELQERKVKFSGQTIVRKDSGNIPVVGPEGQLEQQREREVAEGKEKTSERAKGTDERQEKKDIRKHMANSEKKMEVNAGVQELEQTQSKEKEELAKAEQNAEDAVIKSEPKSDPNAAT